MKKVVLLLILFSTFSFAKKWEYLFYVTGIDFSNKKMQFLHVINDGKKVGSASRGKDEEESIANAKMLNQYMGYKYNKAYELDILNSLGNLGWELISIQVDGANKKYHFKR